MTMKITIEHNGVTYSGQVMKITRTSLGYGDRGIFTSSLELSGGSIGVTFGAYCLDSPDKDEDDNYLGRKGTAYGLDYIIQVLNTLGGSDWESLKGKTIIALFENSGWGGLIQGIASIDGEKVFIPKEHAEMWLNNEK